VPPYEARARGLGVGEGESEGGGEGKEEREGKGSRGEGALLRRGLQRGSLLWETAAGGGTKPLFQTYNFNFWGPFSEWVSSMLGSQQVI